MNHVWKYEDWRGLSVKDMRSAFLLRAATSPALGSLSVGDLCCLTSTGDTPVGIYVFSSESEILYVGKTHGRSLHERMISHVDHRDPIEGSPHLAQFVSSLVKKDAATSREQAVNHILNMKVTWLPIPDLQNNSDFHKRKIAIVERRLLWKDCLDPKFNSPRVKKNSSFVIKGVRHHLSPEIVVGEVL